MRKILAFITAFILLILFSFSVLANDSSETKIKIYVDGQEIACDKEPVILNSRILVPIRQVAQACDISVGWDGEKSQVTLTYGFNSAAVTIGSNKMQVYNSVIDSMSTVELDTAPIIIDGSAYIILRAPLEAVGASVEWDGENNTAHVTSPGLKAVSSQDRDADKTEDKGEIKEKEEKEENQTNTEKETSTDTVKKEDSEKTETPKSEPSDDSKNQSQTDKKDNTTTGNQIDGFSYTGFREMPGDTIIEHAPHGLYGRIKTDKPITLVRCRIVGTQMDYTLWFNKDDNLKNYNVFTYFDKLICFSDAGVGEHTFEVYAAVEGQAQQLIFSYTYTITSVDGKSENVENSNDTQETTDEKTETQNPDKEDSSDGEIQDTDENSQDVEEPKDTDSTREGNEENQEDILLEKEDMVISYYGFRKMTDNKIAQGAPHGLYGNIVSNYPITTVRCRIAGTEMDYVVDIPKSDNITTYNVFNVFDDVICFSDAGLGKQKFDIFVGADGKAAKLIFSYNYTVVEKTASSGSTTITEPSSERDNTDNSDNTDNADNTDKKETTETEDNTPEELDVCLPLEGTIKVTSPYGFRAYNRWEFHKGVDIISDSLNIIAVADGTVVDCATGKNSGAGNYVAIQHEGGWVSLYYHLASYEVEIGDKVKKGDVFATMGNSGGNYGIHLHFMTCDNWYGGIWATQNNHHKPPHEYIPQLLTDAVFYNPSYEKTNQDKMILCNFRFPTIAEQGKPISISSSSGFVASENPLSSLNLSVTDKDGNVLLSETVKNPKYYVSGLYTYTNISYDFDNICEFDKLPAGTHTVSVTAVSSKGRKRVIYEKEFSVVSSEEYSGIENEDGVGGLSPEETAKTDAFEGDERTQ